MEVTVQGSDSLKIRGKHAAIQINPVDKAGTYNAIILLANPDRSKLKINDEVVVIDGPGEYEAGGIKISGMRVEGMTAYSLSVDGIEVILGDIKTLDKLHQKVKEHNIALIYSPEEQSVSFATSLASNALLFYGEKSTLVVDGLAKEEKKVLSKYQVTLEKLPSEMETILLASS